ncbi:cancer-associated gene 1 protein isoform X12 [Monodelphis domestica]|uniref:cancer-associated gene 1 protein isoform X12 n=1 Tax=Monodelphis domestica TaxID=13616 RepID=UPI0024E2297D|nr:cancer-associated gene 1 protein isoform X12 [Monodelphis domestica]
MNLLVCSWAFRPSTLQNNDYGKYWSSPTEAEYFEEDTSNDQLEIPSEADATNIHTISEDLTHSDSHLCEESSSITSDLLQDKIHKIQREKEPTFTIYKDYATLDNFKHDNSLKDHLETVLISPDNTKSIIHGGFDSICKFHKTEDLNNEGKLLRNDDDQLSSTGQPAPQNQFCGSTSSIKQEKNLEQNDTVTIFIKKEVYTEQTLVNAPKSPHLTIYDEFEEPLPISEESLFDSIIKDTSINLKKTSSFLFEKNVCTEVGESYLKEGFDQTAIHTAQVIDAEHYIELTNNLGDTSILHLPCPLDKNKELVQDLIQSNRCDPKNRMSNILCQLLDGENDSYHFEVRRIFVNPKESKDAVEGPEKSNICPKKVKEESENHNENFLTYFTDTSSWSEASIEDFNTQDAKQGFESLTPLVEEHIDFNDVINTLKQDNHKQQNKILELECSNLYLENNVKELQMKISKQEVFVDIINKLKENVEELIEDKYKVILEKKDIENSLKNLQKASAEIKKQLEESILEKNTLILELKSMKTDYVLLQEQHKNELELKNKSLSYCLEMDKILNKKEEEIGKLQNLRGELETVTSALEILQTEFQRHEEVKIQERQELKSSLGKLVAQVKVLQSNSENERAKNAKLQQQINKVKNENAKLLQQVERSEEQNYNWKLETAQWKQQLEEIIESDTTKDTDNPDTEHLYTRKNVYDKMKYFNLKKKSLEKELLKHKERISAFRELIANEKASQEEVFEDKVNDLEELENYSEMPGLLGNKLDRYHNLNEELNSLIGKLTNLLEYKEDQCNKLMEENDEYQKHLGSLINKILSLPPSLLSPLPEMVTSYEEIIECADQRLEISHSQIAHLEKKNRQLEDIIKKPKPQISSLRTKGLEKQPKSMTMVPHILEANRKDLNSTKLKTKYCQSYSHPRNRVVPQ